MYSINEIAKLCDISKSKIRYYDKHNLLRPDVKRDENNHRVFTSDDIIWINDVKCFLQTGVSLSDLKQIINSIQRKDYEKTAEVFKLQQQVLIENMKQLQIAQERVEYKIKYYEEKVKNGKF